MGTMFQIRNHAELNHILHLQQSMTRRALMELDDIPKGVFTQANQDDEEYVAEISMQREADLLARYAALPTLTEHEKNPNLRLAVEAGATFAVAAIVGGVILEHLRTLANVFTKVHRMLLMVTLHEFDNPVSDDIDLVETFLRCMKVELHADVQAITEEERKRRLRDLLRPLAEAMITVTSRYKLVENVDEGGWALTPVGVRVMLHLFDVQRFIESVADAHRCLQQ